MIQGLEDALALAAVALALAGAPVVVVAIIAGAAVLWTLAQVILYAQALQPGPEDLP